MASQPDALAASQPDDAVIDEPNTVSAEMYPDEVRDEGTAEGDDATAPDGADDASSEEGGEPIEAPISWPAEDKEHFSKLPRELQERVSRREAERERYVHSKSAEAQQAIQAKDREGYQVVRQLQENHAAALQQALSMLGAAEAPDERLLYSGNEQDRALYYQQDAAFRRSQAQHQQVQQRVLEARQQVDVIAQAQRQQELQEGAARLAEALQSDWTDPSKQKLLLDSLEPIGRELGYADRFGEADATDILALKTALGWKQDADKWRNLQKAKMEPVRAAKLQPKTVQPGVAGERPGGTPPNAAAILYPNDVRR